MRVEIITSAPDLLIRRTILETGEATPWHSDACRRFSVIVRGARLAIEYRATAERVEVEVHAGMTGWDDPEPRVHRAVNVGPVSYEEVVTFYRASAEQDPQPSTA